MSKIGEFGWVIGTAAAVINNTLIGIGSYTTITSTEEAIKHRRETQAYLIGGQTRAQQVEIASKTELAKSEAEAIRLANRGLITTVIVGGGVSLGLLALLIGVIYAEKED